jgi:hypothetical protein
MKVALTIAPEEENAIKVNVFAMKDFLEKIAVRNPARETVLITGIVKMGYVCVEKDLLENFVKRLR